MRIEPLENALKLRAGDRTYLLGLARGEIAPGFVAEASLWLARLHEGDPERILVCGTGLMGHTEARLITPQGSVVGSPCLSWDAP